MATDLSINKRKEAAMRSMENSLSHFGDFGTLPRRHRYPKMLHMLQLEKVAEILAGLAEQIINDTIDAENEAEAIEREYALKAAAIMGKRTYKDDTPDASKGLPHGSNV